MPPIVPDAAALLSTLPETLGPALHPPTAAEVVLAAPAPADALPLLEPSAWGQDPGAPSTATGAGEATGASNATGAGDTGAGQSASGTTTPATTTESGGSGGHGGSLWMDFLGGLEEAVRTATGPVGLAIIFTYSFLIAFVLPLPSEVVLAAPLRLGLPTGLQIALIMVVSGAGKATGSVFAFHIGHGAKQSGPVIRLLRRSRFDVVEWSERKTVQLARQYGYVGLALALCVPGFPDTLSIYAFSVLGEDYAKFAAATFAGSVGRLLITVAFIGGAIVLI